MDEAPTKVPSEYADFADVFSPKLVAKLLEHMRINIYAIELVDNQQPPYSLIYSLGLVELKILKAYIKNNQANGFIRPPKSPARAPIFFNKKSDGSLIIKILIIWQLTISILYFWLENYWID